MAAIEGNLFVTQPRPGIRRRNNAPIRPRREPSSAPDLAFALAAAAAVMAGIFAAATFLVPDLSRGDAGTDLARVFAAFLALAAVSLGAAGVLLSAGSDDRASHVIAPAGIGAAIGVAEALILLRPAPALIPVPFVLLVFALRPVRRILARRARGR
ncbi:hypothetical protein [Tepidiforma sp.]|uniref:hypothetical protein n=1 Tax=Tepidiforma sp. TaxID=2682230 RepID=UPI002ADDD79C|nr:hypothetical protein [Tepidiforma sp.]